MNRLAFLAALMTVALICHAPLRPTRVDGPSRRARGISNSASRSYAPNHCFMATGSKTEIPKVSGNTTSLYGEFGLLDRVTLVGYMPFYSNLQRGCRRVRFYVR